MKNIPIYDYVMERLSSSKGNWPYVAAGSGVSKRTIEKIARKEIIDPGVSHIQKLADYFNKTKTAREKLREEFVAASQRTTRSQARGTNGTAGRRSK